MLLFNDPKVASRSRDVWYLCRVDCNVTGSDAGTYYKPKFSLMLLFQNTVFPRIAELVGPGDNYEGYVPVLQGDNSGPHQDATFPNFCKYHCEVNEWLWKPQAAQMPHMNNLDLAVSPAMSKRHSENTVFPRIADLVGPGDDYEGYVPVLQGDNSGPHQDATFLNFCKDHCEVNEWLWEPQAAQMPHMNNLNLAVFPAMSKRHSDMLRDYSNSVAPPDRIWEGVEAVWSRLESFTIARGYVLAHRIATEVISAKGCNTFLRGATFHCQIRKDFPPSKNGRGIMRITPVIEYFDCY